MYMAHTERCRTRDTQAEEDKASGGWVLDGNTEEGGETRTSTGGGTTSLRGEGGSGVDVNGVRQHARASLECNHHCKNMRVCTFQN